MKKLTSLFLLLLLTVLFVAIGETKDNPIAVSSGSKDGTEKTTNTFYGQDAGTEGDENTFYGKYAGTDVSTGTNDTFLGAWAGRFNNTGTNNTFIGNSAGRNNTSGHHNTFLGEQAGYHNTSGNNNVFLGKSTGNSNTMGYDNIFIGRDAGYYNSTGDFNTFIGTSAGYFNTTGITNTFLGYYAGYHNTTGYGNTFIGSMAGFNEIGLNKLYIDNSDTSDPLIYGEFDNNIVNINGKLGIGTKTPGYPMEIVRTGANASIVVNRTDGAKNYVNATATHGNFGTVNNYPLRLVVNSAARMTLNSNNSLAMASGATCTAGGTWTNASSIALKENITLLNSDEAATTLLALNPVKYNYKAEQDENHVGFIAEEVPELVAMKDRKSLSPMDIVAVLTKVTQDQQKVAQDQQKTIENLTRKMLEQQQLNQHQLQLTQEQQKQFQNQQQLTQKQLQDQQQINEKMKMEIAELKMKLSE
jgi:hypothetical protein